MEKILSLNLMKTVTKIATDCELVSSDFAKQYKSNAGTYFRFNVTHGTGILAVDDWQRESDILAHTNAYLRDPNTSRMIEEMIECLCSSSSLEKVHTLGTFGMFYLFSCFKKYPNANIAGHIPPVSKITMISLPPFLSSLFIGRQDYFLKLQKYFASREKPWKRWSFLLYGMGGIGKSQIALKFAHNEQKSK